MSRPDERRPAAVQPSLITTHAVEPDRPSRHGWIEVAVLAVAFLAVGWFYVWTAKSNGRDWRFGQEQQDYYNLLVHGWRDGHLAMKVNVPDALLRLPDPYDPDKRPAGLGLHDASFYRGRYYLYFGVTPAVMALLPFRLLTGIDLPLPVAVLALTYLGFAASASTWLAIRRRYFPRSRTAAACAGVLALGIAGLGPVLVRRPDVWELPIAGGYAFAMVAFACLYRALGVGRLRWVVLAAASLGLAIASRPTYLVTTPALLVVLFPVAARWRAGQVRGREAAKSAAAIVAPLACIGLLLAWHNYARFGNPLEFGQRYQLSSMYESKLVHFSARFVPFNAKLYFAAPARLSRYFPFINGIAARPAPEGYGGFEDVYGVFPNLPIACLALLAPYALRRRDATARRALGLWLGAVTFAFGAISLLVLFFFGAHGRYMLDFTPALILLAMIGVLALERELSQAAGVAGAPGKPASLRIPSVLRWIAHAAWLGGWAYSVAFALLFSLTATRIFPEKRPQEFARIARVVNHLPWWFDALTGTTYGPVELSVRLSHDPGGREALVTTGWAADKDTVFVELTPERQVRFGGVHGGGIEQVSRPLALDLSRPHRIRISMGSLFPPETYPLFKNADAADVLRWRGRLVIQCDGETVLDVPQPFHPSSPGAVRIGPAAAVAGMAGQLRGEVLHSERVAVSPRDIHVEPRHCVRLRLALPASSSGWEPLLSVGGAGSGELIAVRGDGDGRCRFARIASGRPPVESPLVPLAARAAHEIVLRLQDSRVPADSPQARGFAVELDGELVWSSDRGPTADDATKLRPAENTVDAPSVATAFAGEIFSRETFLENADPLAQVGGPVRMVVRLPAATAEGHDPLLVTGRAGTADFLFLSYLSGDDVRFGFDHWGGRSLESDPVRIDRGRPHEILISLPSVLEAPPKGAFPFGRGELRVEVDGRVVWRQAVDFYRPAAGEVFIGRNPVGGSSCGARFRGDILNADRGAAGNARH